MTGVAGRLVKPTTLELVGTVIWPLADYPVRVMSHTTQYTGNHGRPSEQSLAPKMFQRVGKKDNG